MAFALARADPRGGMASHTLARVSAGGERWDGSADIILPRHAEVLAFVSSLKGDIVEHA